MEEQSKEVREGRGVSQEVVGRPEEKEIPVLDSNPSLDGVREFGPVPRLLLLVTHGPR